MAVVKEYGEKSAASSRGFSLVELLVVVSIFTIITAVVLISYNRFSGQTLLTSLAYDIAFSLREAQSFGLSVRGTSVGDFDTGYGLYFDATESNAYIFFADLNRDGLYGGDLSCAGGSECIDKFILGGRYSISNICATTAAGVEKCVTTPTAPLTYLTVIFDRPEPDAIISSNFTTDTYHGARIVIQATNGQEQIVSVATTGQISVGP